MGILDGILGVGQVLGDAVTAGYNNAAQREANMTNIQLQHEAWAREDNAVQRRVADLNAAGLNPILAAGSAAQSSSPVRVAPVSTFMPDLSRLYSVGLAKQQAARTEADAVVASMNARKAEQDQHLNDLLYPQKLVSSGRILDASMNADYDEARARSSLADLSVKIADAQRREAEKNAELIEKYGEYRTITAPISGLAGAIANISKIGNVGSFVGRRFDY